MCLRPCPGLQVALASGIESLTTVSLTPHQAALAGASAPAFTLADLVARDVGSRQQQQQQGAPAAGAAQQQQQLLYAVQWQAASAAAACDCVVQQRQPLLAAVLGRGMAVAVAAPAASSVTAPAAQLLQALQTSAASDLRSAKQWLLSGSAPAMAGLSIVPANASQAAAASLHGMLKVAAAEQLIAADAAIIYGSGAAPAGSPSSGSRQFGESVHAAAAYTPVLLPTSAGVRGSSTSAAMQGEAAACGAVVITGGLGGLGMLTAAWMQQQSQQPGQHLVLLGRSGRSSSADAAAAAVTSSASCLVSMTRCDVAAAEEAAAAVAAASRHHSLQAVLHAGGVLADALLLNQTAAKLRAVAAPKLSGLQLLGAAAACLPLQQLLLYSSIAGELGTAGQGNYAAANSALDAAAAHLQLQGRASSSVQWGAWAGAGMAAGEPQLLQKLQRQGYAAVQPVAGLAALQQLLAGSSSNTDAAAIMAAPFDWRRFLAGASRRALPYLAAVLPEERPALQAALASLAHLAASAAPSAAQTVTPAEVLPVVQQLLADLAGSAGTDSSAPAADVPFLEAGLDSIGAVELRQASTGCRLMFCTDACCGQSAFNQTDSKCLAASCTLTVPPAGTAWQPALTWSCPPPSSSTTPRPPAWLPTCQQNSAGAALPVPAMPARCKERHPTTLVSHLQWQQQAMPLPRPARMSCSTSCTSLWQRSRVQQLRAASSR